MTFGMKIKSLCKWKRLKRDIILFVQGIFLGRRLKLRPKKIKNPFDIYVKRGLGSSTILVTKELVGKKRFTNLRYSQDIEFWYKLFVVTNSNITLLMNMSLSILGTEAQKINLPS